MKLTVAHNLFCGKRGLDSKSVKLLFTLPSYAAQRNVFLTSTASILGEMWPLNSDAWKINFLLYGIKSVNYDINYALFHAVQSFIIMAKRFLMATVCISGPM